MLPPPLPLAPPAAAWRQLLRPLTSPCPLPLPTPQSTRSSKLADNKELKRLQGPLGGDAKQMGTVAAQLGRGLRHRGPPPMPQAQVPAGKGLASASKAAKTPAAKAPAAKAPASAAKGKRQASPAQPAAKGKRQLLDKVRTPRSCIPVFPLNRQGLWPADASGPALLRAAWPGSGHGAPRRSMPLAGEALRRDVPAGGHSVRCD